MASENPSSSTARRNRMIAIAAGAITVVAIVFAFASGYLGQQWNWLRPAGELLLLAELVGLIVLERHQLFEPVQEKVTGMEARMAEMQTALGQMRDLMTVSGQVTVTTGFRESFQLRTRLLREALMREQQGPQILRNARLSGFPLQVQDTREGRDEWRAFNEVMSRFLLLPGSVAGSSGHRWSARSIWAFASIGALNSGLEFILSLAGGTEALNVEIKVQLRSRAEALLSPVQITDRDVFLSYDDELSSRWGLALQGQQYVALFARWFDDRWSAIPDSYLIYSRNGLNQKAVDRIRKELEGVEVAGERKTA